MAFARRLSNLTLRGSCIMDNRRQSSESIHDHDMTSGPRRHSNKMEAMNTYTTHSSRLPVLSRMLWIFYFSFSLATVLHNTYNTPVENSIQTAEDALCTKCVLDYNLTIHNPNLCNFNTRQLVVIISAPPYFGNRSGIRATWGSQLKRDNQSAMLFLLGRSGNESVNAAIYRENQEHGDILQVDYVESYRKVTTKMLHVLQWIPQNCPSAQYVLKMDDDMFLNVANLKHLIDHLNPGYSSTNFVMGQLAKNFTVRRSGCKHPVTKAEYPEDVYPDFIPGPYLLGRDAVRSILPACLTFPYFPWEDVFLTGICAEKALVKRVEQLQIINDFRKHDVNTCSLRKIITDVVIPSQKMQQFWTEVTFSNSTECV